MTIKQDSFAPSRSLSALIKCQFLGFVFFFKERNTKNKLNYFTISQFLAVCMNI